MMPTDRDVSRERRYFFWMFPVVQLAVAEFMREGHYMRHLRRAKRHDGAQQQTLLNCLQSSVSTDRLAAPGLAVFLKLPQGTSDVAVAREALTFGMSPSPLSAWYTSPDSADSGLLLGVATVPRRNLASVCDQLLELIRRFS